MDRSYRGIGIQVLGCLAVLGCVLGCFASVQSTPPTNSVEVTRDTWYLLVRRAGRPEKNYYEMSRTAQLVGGGSDEVFKTEYQPSPRDPGVDLRTDSTIRYGVYQAWKVRVVGVSDSVKAPTSVKDVVYVLTYSRDPDWKFCAKKYSVTSSKAGARRVVYIDFRDGKEYVIELSAKWPRPLQIYEIDILNANAFVDILQASKRALEGVH